MSNKFWLNIIMLGLITLLSACGGGGSDDNTGDGATSGSSNWNAMKWDQDKWS